MAVYFVHFLDASDTPKGDDAPPLTAARRGGGGVLKGYRMAFPNMAAFDGWLNALPPDVMIGQLRESVRLGETAERARLLLVLDAGRTQRVHALLFKREEAPGGEQG
jgi:hypothetical protein